MKIRIAIGAGALTLLTACPPPPPTNTSPVISAFSAVTPSGSTPITTALTWTISDTDNDPLTCRIDLENDGTYDKTVAACTSASLRTATFTSVGVTTVKLQVTDGTSTPATATTAVTLTAANPDTFQITVRLGSGVPPEAAAIFQAATARWEAVIKTGLADENLPYPADFCRPGTAAITSVDDVLIDFDVFPIDGPGGADANASPCDFRTDGSPILGTAKVDVDDLANFTANPRYFLDVMTHEIGHVLGIGIGDRWTSRIDTTTQPGNPVFTGKAANGIYQELGGTDTIPVRDADDNATGTPAHWSENVFGIELLTPESPNTEVSPLSAMTAAALADQGYGVNLAGADPYALGQTSPEMPAARAASTVRSH